MALDVSPFFVMRPIIDSSPHLDVAALCISITRISAHSGFAESAERTHGVYDTLRCNIEGKPREATTSFLDGDMITLFEEKPSLRFSTQLAKFFGRLALASMVSGMSR